MSSGINAEEEDNLFPFFEPSERNLKLALKDPGLPSLTIKNVELSGEDIAVSFQSSRPLEGDEVVICMLFDQYGGEKHLIGWSNYDSGSITLHGIGEREYQLMLMAGIIGGAKETAYIGTASVYDKTISALKISGIKENEVFRPNERISFSTTEFAYHYLEYAGEDEPLKKITIPWIPVSWEVNDEIKSDWEGGPFTGEFTIPDLGEYQLTVTYQAGDDEPKTETRSVNFIIKNPDTTNANKYAVSYHPNGGTGSTPVDTRLYSAGGVVKTLPGDGLYKSGYVLIGWSLADGTRITDTFTMPNRDITLFAVWVSEVTDPPKTGDSTGISGISMLLAGLAMISILYLAGRRAKQR